MSSDADSKNSGLTEEQIFWDNFSDTYEAINANTTIQGASILHSRMELSSATNVLEIACASGIGTKDLLSYLNSSQSVVATDHSPLMVTKAKAELSSFPNVAVKEADAMDLSSVVPENDSVDRYVSSLCLQLVDKPDAMLSEAFRVLKPGGIAGFTVWGEEHNSAMFTIWKETLSEFHGKEEPRSAGFELGSDAKRMKERILAAGFKSVTFWPAMCVIETKDASKYSESQLPMYKRMCGETDPEALQKLDDIFTRRSREWLESGKPIGLEVYVILAYKH